MAAFVMAYSFTEQVSSKDDDDDDNDDDDDDDNDDNEVKRNDSAPAMVPMADILNHISNNNAHLEFGAESLTMVATQDIHKVKSRVSTIEQHLRLLRSVTCLWMVLNTGLNLIKK